MNKIEKVLKEAVVVFPVRDNKVLLAIKTRYIGEGCWNGYGGGVEKGETVLQSAARECKEESGLKLSLDSLEKVANIDCYNTKVSGEKFVCKLHVFLLRSWEGEPIETEEMITPTWFNFKNLPLDKMMFADRLWIPQVLNGKKIIGEVHYGPFQKTLLKPSIFTEVEYLE